MTPVLIIKRQDTQLLDDDVWEHIVKFYVQNRKIHPELGIRERTYNVEGSDETLYLIMVCTNAAEEVIADIDWDEIPIDKIINGPDGIPTEIFFDYGKESLLINHPSVDEDKCLDLFDWLVHVGYYQPKKPGKRKPDPVKLKLDTIYQIKDEGTDEWMDDFKYVGQYRLPGNDTPNYEVHIFLSTKQLDHTMTYLDNADLNTDHIQPQI